MKVWLKVLIALFWTIACVGCSTVSTKDIKIRYDQSLSSECPVDKIRIVFVNDSSDVLYAFTGTIGIKLNGNTLSVLKRNEYLQVFESKGKHKLFLEHWDVVAFKNEYDVNLTEDINIIKVYATPVGNEYKIIDFTLDYIERNYRPAY